MKQFLKKHYKRIIIISFDILLIPTMFICNLLTNGMLKTDNPCMWTKLGGQCISCGGTHFVNDITSFRFAEAFMDNQLMFLTVMYWAITLVVLNLYFLFNLTFAKKILKVMYSIPMFIIFVLSIFGFLFWRNIPLIINVFKILWYMISTIISRTNEMISLLKAHLNT
jgi:hypothetical protein